MLPSQNLVCFGNISIISFFPIIFFCVFICYPCCYIFLKPNTTPIHPMNRRFHFARLDKTSDFPRTNLFAPEGLFDLHISDDESGKSDGPVNKAGAATASTIEEDVVVTKIVCYIPLCSAPCKTTKLVSEPTIHSLPDHDIVITKVISSANHPTTRCPQIFDVEHVKPSKSTPQVSLYYFLAPAPSLLLFNIFVANKYIFFLCN